MRGSSHCDRNGFSNLLALGDERKHGAVELSSLPRVQRSGPRLFPPRYRRPEFGRCGLRHAAGGLLGVGELTTHEYQFEIVVEIDLPGTNPCGSLRPSKAADDLIFGLP